MRVLRTFHSIKVEKKERRERERYANESRTYAKKKLLFCCCGDDDFVRK